jgi:hypothetical protein
MKNNPRFVGESAAFDWTVLDNALADTASRNAHVAWRVIMHFPGQDTKVPQYLIDAGVSLQNGSPNFGDPKVLEAMEQFISSCAKRYDGDKRLGFVQAGLLGKWGEWHADSGLLTQEAKDKVIGWYAASFKKTKVQIRYPSSNPSAAGFGYHDDSFAYETLDGDYNGGQVRSYYFWPSAVKNGVQDFWKRSAMGGETRGEVASIIFEDSYPGGTFQKQRFMDCVIVTHCTYMFHHVAFKVSSDLFGFYGALLSK